MIAVRMALSRAGGENGCRKEKRPYWGAAPMVPTIHIRLSRTIRIIEQRL